MSLNAQLKAFADGELPLHELAQWFSGDEKVWVLGEADEEEEGRARPHLVLVEGSLMGVLLSEPQAAIVAAQSLNLFEEDAQIQVHAMELPRSEVLWVLRGAGASGAVVDLAGEDEWCISPELFHFIRAETALDDLAEMGSLFVWVSPTPTGPEVHLRKSQGREILPVFTHREFADQYRGALTHPDLVTEDVSEAEKQELAALSQEGTQPTPLALELLLPNILRTSALGLLVDPGQPGGFTLTREQVDRLQAKIRDTK